MQSYVITSFVASPFTANHSDGTIEVSVADAVKLWPGARGVISSDTQPAVEVLILEDLGTGHFKVRLDPSYAPNAGGPVAVQVPAAGSDWSAYLVADNATITQPANQMIWPYTREGIIPRTPSALQGI